MPQRSVFDTRFFVEYFYSDDERALARLKEDLRSTQERVVSVVTIHEIYKIDLEREGREVASLRGETIRRDFMVVDLDYDLAVESAEIRRKYRIPFADSVVIATAQMWSCPVVSDDPHFEKVKEVKTRWIR